MKIVLYYRKYIICRTFNIRKTYNKWERKRVFRKYGIPQYNYNNQLYIIGYVGNDDALEHHLEQYNELGFTNDRIIIFERQLSTYNALKRKLETLKISKNLL